MARSGRRGKSKNGIATLSKQYKVLERIYPESMKRFVIQETEILKDEVTKRTPVDTGRLRAAFHSEQPVYDDGKWTISLSNNVEYAEYVEYGHRWVKRGMSNIKLENYNPETDKTGFTRGKFMARDGAKATQDGQGARYAAFVQKIMDKIGKRR